MFDPVAHTAASIFLTRFFEPIEHPVNSLIADSVNGDLEPVFCTFSRRE